MKINKIFNDAKDKNVAKVVVYADASDVLFYTEDFAEGTEVPAEDCLDLFYKGVVAVKNNVVYSAVSCTAAGVIDFGF